MYFNFSPLLSVLFLLLAPSTAWLHGKPEPGLDNRYRSQSATEMLNRLWGAARERADEARAQRAQAEQEGRGYSPNTPKLCEGQRTRGGIENVFWLLETTELYQIHKGT